MNNAASHEDSSCSSALFPQTTEQPEREKNIAAIIAYFESGIKDNKMQLGIELEHTMVHSTDMSAVPYSADHGVRWILEQLKADYPEPLMDGSDLIGVARPGESITIEPAAQLEISAGPFNSLRDAETTLTRFENRLESLVSQQGIKALLIGYHPSSRANDLELIPKRRYCFMNDYLSAISSFGPCMMRGSAATQVSIDYLSTEDCLRKLRLASALVPLFSLISDNAPIFEGQPREHALPRTEIWQHCDPDRCGLVPNILSDDFSLRKYAEYILDTPAILVPDATERWRATSETFGEIYAHSPMERPDVEHALSMFFNDVRLKTYIEIRPADAMPIPYALAYAALIKGIFYSEQNLKHWLERLRSVTQIDVDRAKEALMRDAWNAQVYEQPVDLLLSDLLNDAHRELSDEDRGYLQPFVKLVEEKVSLAQTLPL